MRSSAESIEAQEALEFLSGGGEMGARIRAFDWAATPVGAPHQWPQSLRLTVRLMLNTQHPMFIWWGPELIQFYNDAYRQTMGPEMHPAALGARGRECWADIWPIIGPQIDLVLAGEGATWNVDQLVPINRHGVPEDVWWTYGFSPIDHEGGIGGVLVVCNDVSEQVRLRDSLIDRTRRMAQQFEQAPGFIAVLRGPNHVFELANAAYRQLVGGRDIIDKPVREALPELEGQGFFELLDKAFRSGRAHIGRRTSVVLRSAPSAPARELFLDFVYQPIKEQDGSISGIFVAGQDVTDHVATEERLNLVNQELRHRVKNTLSTIVAVANQTLRQTIGEDALQSFTGRVAAFGAAHDALTGEREAPGAVGEVIKLALDPHVPAEGRYTTTGPHVVLAPRQAQSLALAVHELATNAAKYGAMSRPEGHIDVSWAVTDGRFHLLWEETGGPPVAAPTRTGFGSRLLKRVLAADLDAEIDLRFEPAGVVFELDAPARALRS